jgi:PAS domain-containing protein
MVNMTLFSDAISLEGVLRPREKLGVTFIGPEFFAVDEGGERLSNIGSVFPRYRTIVTVRGIHAYHIAIMTEFLKLVTPPEELPEPGELEGLVCNDAVPLVFRDDLIIVRCDPSAMENVFAADLMLQTFFPKRRIQFTGLHIPQIRTQLRRRGECWRMSPTPRSVVEICRYVRASKVQVGTGLSVYYNEPTGGRFLTYDEFLRIRPLHWQHRTAAPARLIDNLSHFHSIYTFVISDQSLLARAGEDLDISELEKAVALIETLPASSGADEALKAFDGFASLFAAAAGPELLRDDYGDPVWRTTMFCRLLDINEEEMEELSLELSPEFHLNVQWLPGASIVDGKLLFDLNADSRVHGLISHLWESSGGLLSVNIGRIQESQSSRDISGEEREVYLVAMTTLDAKESISLIRLMKWDVIHRMKMGIPLDQAIEDTFKYRDYIFDRLHAAARLGFPILTYREIRLELRLPGVGPVPSFFFERQYVTGVVSDKIPLSCYRTPDFIENLSCLLGLAAAFTLVLGRVSFRTGKVFFDDGDELIQLDSNSIPSRLVIIETTGSFTDWTTPIAEMLPKCLKRFRTHLEKAADSGVNLEVVERSVGTFAESLCNKINELREAVLAPSSELRALFDDRPPGQAGIRDRWEGIIHRQEDADVKSLRTSVLNSRELRLAHPR